MLGIRIQWAAGALALLGLAGCADLADIQQNQCGNGIVEQPNNEDCDTLGVGLDGGVSDAGNACSAQCRVLCGDAGTCPWGWGCDLGDGICRRPKGSFTATAVPVNENVEHLLLGDVDGSGRKGIVVDTGSQLNVHYVDSSGAVSRTTSFTVAKPTPAVGDFDGDGIDDIVYRLATAFTVRTGGPDQTLAALPFSVPLPGPGMVQTTPDLELKVGERLVAISVPGITSGQKLKELLRLGSTSVSTLLPDTVKLKTSVLAAVGTSSISAGAGVVVGKWVESSPCDQFVLANTTSGNLEIYFACRDTLSGVTWNDVTDPAWVAPVKVPLPAGLPTIGPVFNVDVDGDGHRDLVFYAAAAGGSMAQLQVAYGDGEGHFGSTPVTQVWTPPSPTGTYMCLYNAQFEPLAPILLAGCEAQVPLAVGDFNGDRLLDVVTPCGIFLWDPSNTPQSCAPGGKFKLDVAQTSKSGLASVEWTQARVADLNGDGVIDVVAASCADTSISYFENAGGGMFNPYLIPTVGGIDDLAVGDFDGDLVKDLMYVERAGKSPECDPAAPTPSDAVSLAVVFGALSGGPSSPAPVAALDGRTVPAIDQIVASFLTDLTGQFNPISNLSVVIPNNSDSTHQLLDIFEGSTNREIVAPYFPVAPDTLMSDPSDAANTPWLIAVGNFGAPQPGLALLTSERQAVGHRARLWLLGQSTGTLSSPGPVTVSAIGDPAEYAADGASKGAWLATVRLGGSSDSIVGLARDTAAGTASLLVLTPSGGALPDVDPPATSLGRAYSGPIVVGDVDADGHDDVVVVSDEDVLVLWNRGTGALDPAAASSHVAAADLAGAKDVTGAPCGAASESIAAVAVLHAAPTLPRQVLILGHAHNYLASVGPASAHPTSVTCVTGLPTVPAGGKALVAAGDLDGDGVDDVVIAQGGSLQLFHGVPVIQ